MSSFKILCVGNHPNLVYYAWKLAQVSAFQVSMANTRLEDILVSVQSTSQQRLPVHAVYKSLKDVKEKHDLVLVSSASLQDMSSLSAQLSRVITANTKIIVESTGYVYLEPFIHMSLEHQVKVMSIISDIQVKLRDGVYSFNDEGINIFIGEAAVSNRNYNADTLKKLSAITDLFAKVFNGTKLKMCSSHIETLTQMWTFALPRITIDPLLVLLEQPDTKSLSEQILAKPLLSGLITEIITLSKAMGVKLPSGYENETALLATWTRGGRFVGDFLYKEPSDIDVLLLQPILLADDYSIKTPYLEFLYATMSQLFKINKGDSRLFARVDESKADIEKEYSSLKSKIAVYSSNEHDLKQNLATVKQELEKSQQQLQALSAEHRISQQQIKDLIQRERNLQAQLTQEKQRVAQQLQAPQVSQPVLQQRTQSSPHVLPRSQASSAPRNFSNSYQQQQSDQFSEADSFVNVQTPAHGERRSNPLAENTPWQEPETPSLDDLQDMAAFIHHSPVVGPPPVPAQDQTIGQPNVSLPSATPEVSSGELSKQVSQLDIQNEFSQREAELKRREQQIQEREMRIRKQASNAHMNGNMPPQSNALQHAPPVGPQFQQSYYQPPAHQFNGHMPNGYVGQSVLSSLPNGSAPNLGPTPQPNFPPRMGHQLRPTSRKNRHSNMPMLRNASSSGIDMPPRARASQTNMRASLMAGQQMIPPIPVKSMSMVSSNGFHASSLPQQESVPVDLGEMKFDDTEIVPLAKTQQHTSKRGLFRKK